MVIDPQVDGSIFRQTCLQHIFCSYIHGNYHITGKDLLRCQTLQQVFVFFGDLRVMKHMGDLAVGTQTPAQQCCRA